MCRLVAEEGERLVQCYTLWGDSYIAQEPNDRTLFNHVMGRRANETHSEFVIAVTAGSFRKNDVTNLLAAVKVARQRTGPFAGRRPGVLLDQAESIRAALVPVHYDHPQNFKDEPAYHEQTQEDRLHVLRLLLLLHFAASTDPVYKINGACQIWVDAIELWLGSRSWTECGEGWDLDVRLHMVRLYQSMIMADTFDEQFASGSGQS
jgi:hypothetical protein